MKFILFIISFCCCIAGALKQTTAPGVSFAATTIAMPEPYSPSGNNDLSPSSASCTSPAQVNFFAGLIPNTAQVTIRYYVFTIVFRTAIAYPVIRAKAYLLHIHPSHSIW